MAKYISALQRIEAMFQSAIEISKKYEIIMVTSNENHTDNTNDYSDNSVKSEFFSDQEQNLIRQTLENIGFKVKCIFRKNRALAPHERSAVPLGTDHCPVG